MNFWLKIEDFLEVLGKAGFGNIGLLSISILKSEQYLSFGRYFDLQDAIFVLFQLK